MQPGDSRGRLGMQRDKSVTGILRAEIRYDVEVCDECLSGDRMRRERSRRGD